MHRAYDVERNITISWWHSTSIQRWEIEVQQEAIVHCIGVIIRVELVEYYQTNDLTEYYTEDTPQSH